MVNTARKNIDKEKKKIEQIRKEAAMENIVNGEDGGEMEESEAEREAKETIAQEKLAYKTSYQNLRELKSEIEQIQKLMERSRKKLQADFDAWYEQQGRGETLTKALLSSDGEKQVEFKPQFNEQPIKQAWASPTYSTATTQSTSSFASSEIRSTGYRDTDADIEAFYKASEILKARRSRS